MNRRLMLMVLLAAVVALALRAPRLDERPMHNDEAVNAIQFGQLWQGGTYKYDPAERHGPALVYATLAIGRLTRAPAFDDYSEKRLRAVTVLFGIGLILLLPLVADGLGRNGTVWAALFTAVSPALSFYSRYYIHEMLLVFFTFLVFGAGWRYWRTRRIEWALLTGAALGLMQATKETFVLTLASGLAALSLNWAWSRWIDASTAPKSGLPLKRSHIVAALGAWGLVWVTLFSSFFSNLPGLLDSLRTFKFWFTSSAGAAAHIHPWNFYLRRLVWFHAGNGPVWGEGLLLLLGIAGAVAGFRRRRLGRAQAAVVRFLAIYSFVLALAYSLIPYKTPWCLVSFWHGTILLAGTGAAVVIRSARRVALRTSVSVLVLLGAVHLGWQAWRAGVNFAADRRNPYVYAQTSPDVLKLVQRVEALARTAPEHYEMPIDVMVPEDDYWPLPWYLRRFKQVGWWDRVRAEPAGRVLIVASRNEGGLEESKTNVLTEHYELRPQVILGLYVQTNLWQEYLAKNPPRPD